MSGPSQTITLQKGNQLFVNTDLSQVFLGGIFSENDSYINNSSYNPITLPMGTAMGRISATGAVVPLDSTANDGSQLFLGLLMDNLILDAGASVNAPICVRGKVAKNQITFYRPGDAMETVVSGRRLQDWITLMGIDMVPTTDLSKFDNS